MKKKISILLVCVVLLMCFPIISYAAETDIQSNEIVIEYFDDGSYMVTEITSYPTRASGSITSYKDQKYYSSDDVLQWTFRLYGTFTYTGSSSTCTDASHTIIISSTGWNIASQSSRESGSKAYGTASMKYYVNGALKSTVNTTVTLTCDNNGNLS